MAFSHLNKRYEVMHLFLYIYIIYTMYAHIHIIDVYCYKEMLLTKHEERTFYAIKNRIFNCSPEYTTKGMKVWTVLFQRKTFPIQYTAAVFVGILFMGATVRNSALP